MLISKEYKQSYK